MIRFPFAPRALAVLALLASLLSLPAQAESDPPASGVIP